MSDPFETPETLRERWKSGIWKEALEAITSEAINSRRAVRATFVVSLGLPEVNGRLDLRGIPFYEVIDPPIGGIDRYFFLLVGPEYKDMDFSYADMKLYARDTSITNCLFLEARLPGLRIRNCLISRCDFSRAFMPWFCAGRGTHFTASVFDNTIVRHHAEICGYASFDDCSFLKLDWRMIKFRRCLFQNCVFSGHLQKAHAERSAGYGLDEVKDFFLRIRHKGCNVFRNCSFIHLLVTRFSVEDRALTLLHCTGFPSYYLPSRQPSADKDFYSENTKPKE